MLNNNNSLSGFISTELSVYNEERFLVPNKRYFFDNSDDGANYNIIYICNGSFRLELGNLVADLLPGDIVVTRPTEKFKLYTNHSLKSDRTIGFAVKMMNFHPLVFAETKGDENFLRAFDERKRYENNIYRKSHFDNPSLIELIINQVGEYSCRNLGYYHFKSAVAVIITQICLSFDKTHHASSVETTDEYQVKIYDYIQRNACTNIKLEEVLEKFSVSSWYVNNVTKRFYGATFRDTVKSIKMFRARAMMMRNDDLQEISRLCGYSTYSGFYRNYIDYFGISPKKDCMHYKKHNDFYNKNAPV